MEKKLLKKHIMKLFMDSNKDHLLITGSKGVGKSTLVKEILNNYNNYGGLTTSLIMKEKIPKKVVLADILNQDNQTIIGYNVKNQMQVVLSGFENHGVTILNKYVNSEKTFIVIDEVGFLELEAIKYQKALFNCFKKKRLIVVLRKENNFLINKIKSMDSIFFVDLDNFISR